jgi:hypothetical protein
MKTPLSGQEVRTLPKTRYSQSPTAPIELITCARQLCGHHTADFPADAEFNKYA